jgi:hypothetical protein
MRGEGPPKPTGNVAKDRIDFRKAGKELSGVNSHAEKKYETRGAVNTKNGK